jgi:hypothetical protein
VSSQDSHSRAFWERSQHGILQVVAYYFDS